MKTVPLKQFLRDAGETGGAGGVITAVVRWPTVLLAISTKKNSRSFGIQHFSYRANVEFQMKTVPLKQFWRHVFFRVLLFVVVFFVLFHKKPKQTTTNSKTLKKEA